MSISSSSIRFGLAIAALCVMSGVASAQSLPAMPTATNETKSSSALPTIPNTKTPAARPAEAKPVEAQPVAPSASELSRRPTSDEIIVVDVAIECASDASRTKLLDELRVRLPEDIRIETSSLAPTNRTLDWSWQANSGCRLVLRDAEGLIELPLPPEPEDEQLRQAVVRVAWFIAMNRDTGALPVAKTAQATPALPKEVNGLPSIPSVKLERGGLLAPPVRAASSDSSTLSTEEQSRLQQFTSSMSSWRTTTPNLFKKFGNFEEEPLTAKFLGEPAVVGANASISADRMRIDPGPAWIMSVRAGITLDERVGLGFVYKRLTSSVIDDPGWATLENPPPDAFNGLGSLGVNLVGMDTEAVLLRRNEWTWRARAGLHMGRMKSVSLDGDGKVSSFLMLGEIDTQVYLAVLPWMDAGLGLGVRAPLLQANDWVASPADLRSGFIVMNLRIKLF